jgi:ATP-dependent protease ClpP protease subunit
MPIATFLDTSCPSIRITGDIDMPLCFVLIDEMKLLHDYYQFRTIELQIDSPGGSADALRYLVTSIADWRQGNGRVLKTLALNRVCSAAAILLSFGTMGHRRALASSRLLYHPVRTVFPQGTVHTVAQLRMTSMDLEDCDSKFLDLLAEHVCRRSNMVDPYKRRLKRLFETERYIEPGEAKRMKLIDEVV